MVIKTIPIPEHRRKRLEKAGGKLLGEIFDTMEEVGKTENLDYQNKRIYINELFIHVISELLKHHVKVLNEMIETPMVAS